MAIIQRSKTTRTSGGKGKTTNRNIRVGSKSRASKADRSSAKGLKKSKTSTTYRMGSSGGGGG